LRSLKLARAGELRKIGIMTHHQDCLLARVLHQHGLEIRKFAARFQARIRSDLLLKADLRRYQRSSLQGAF
jgi:hypothetical protein